MKIRLDKVSFDDLAARTMALFPDFTRPMINAAIINAVQGLMEYVKPHREVALPVQQGVSEYDLNLLVEDGLQVLTVRSVKFCGCCVGVEHNCFSGYEFDEEGWLTLDPSPGRDSADDYVVDVELGITEDACAIPTVLVRRHGKALQQAVFAEIMATPGTPAYDVQRAAVHGNAVKALMVEARTHRALRGKSGIYIQRGERVL